MEPRSEHRWTIDLLDESSARVLEDSGHALSIPRHLLPDAAREGDVLTVERRTHRDGEVTLVIAIDAAATAREAARAEQEAARALAMSRRRDVGGDLLL